MAACALMLHLHRYMSTSAQAIGVNAQFLYAPNCMLISFLVSPGIHQCHLLRNETDFHKDPVDVVGQLLTSCSYCLQDKGTRTTKMTMVTSCQGIDLGRMRCVHEIYLDVLHGIITFDEGTGRLEEVMSRERRYCDSLCVLMCKPTPNPLSQGINKEPS